MWKSPAISDQPTLQKDGITCDKICQCQDHLVYFGGHLWLLWDVVVVLLGFLPVPSTADAIVEIVISKVNPSAQLPITYPHYEDGSGITHRLYIFLM